MKYRGYFVLLILLFAFAIIWFSTEFAASRFAITKHQTYSYTPQPVIPISIVEPEPPASVAIEDLVDMIDTERMISHVVALADEIGVRRAGSDAEDKAAKYITEYLESLGYSVSSDTFNIDGGLVSSNVWCELEGENELMLLIGAHFDSKPPAPGANDNASGIAVMLELACILKDVVPPYTCMFVGFGAEEIIDNNRDHHHYGSRKMSADGELRSGLYSMTSIDMVSVGTEFYIHNLGIIDDSWRNYLHEIASEMGLPCNQGVEKPWSDHEAFEHYGIQGVWIHWRKDSAYHTAADRTERVQPELLSQTTELMIRAICGMTDSSLVPLRRQPD